MVRDSDGTIRQVTAEQAQEARREYAPVLRITAEIIGGTVRMDLQDFTCMPFVFVQVLNIHRDFVKQRENENG